MTRRLSACKDVQKDAFINSWDIWKLMQNPQSIMLPHYAGNSIQSQPCERM